jgi:hypothetical protein
MSILHVLDSSSVHHKEFFHCIHSNQDGTESHLHPARKLSANLYDIYHCYVYSEKKTPEDGQTNWPKHVEFYSKNKFEKLMHLIGFIIRTISND